MAQASKSAETDLDWLEEMVATVADLLEKAREDNKRAGEILKGAFDEEAIKQLRKEIDSVHTNLTQLYYDEAMQKFEDEDVEGKKLTLSRSFNARAVMQVGEDTEQMKVTLARAWNVDAAVSVIMKIHYLNSTLEEAEKSLQALRSAIWPPHQQQEQDAGIPQTVNTEVTQMHEEPNE